MTIIFIFQQQWDSTIKGEIYVVKNSLFQTGVMGIKGKASVARGKIFFKILSNY
jgi:hypothetical protein